MGSKIDEKYLIGALRDATNHPQLKLFLQSIQAQVGRRSVEDIMILFKQVLMTEFDKTKTHYIRVDSDKLPTGIDWKSCGLVARKNGNEFVISSIQETAIYLENSSSWYDFKYVRSDRSFISDPFFPFKNYNNEGQREGVRTFLSAPEGSTTLIQLPTSSGKSVLFTLPLFLNPTNRQLTLVVVPTVSLALDQERRIHHDKQLGNNFKHPLAWHSDLSDFDKEQIKNRIRNGQQYIVFVNPETLSRSLVSTLFEAAKNKTLKNIFVDEAHLIGEWGDQFRIEFQNLGMLRNALLKYQPALKTILLSATINEYSEQLLARIFSDENSAKFGFCSFNFMREEPAYFSVKVSNEDKEAALLDIFRRTPRPAMFYANTPDEVQKFGRVVREVGHKSFEMFSGKTHDSDRKKIIKKWDKGELDVIIATSAFGVGVDKGNVRSVIHFAVPETLDRYYQEVGRSGRDGYSSTAIAVFSAGDLGTTKSRITKYSFMGDEKAWQRWEYLVSRAHQNRIKISNKNLLMFDLSEVMPWLPGQSKANNMWNHYVLRIMEQQKYVRRHFLPPDEFSEHIAPDCDEETFWDLFTNKVAVEIIDEMFADQNEFRQAYNQINPLLFQSLSKSNQALIKVLEGESPMEKALSKTYSIPNRNIFISEACRGCSKHSKPLPVTSRPFLVRSALQANRSREYTELFNDSMGYVFYGDDLNELENFIPWVIRHAHISNVILCGKVQQNLQVLVENTAEKLKNSRQIFIDRIFDPTYVKLSNFSSEIPLLMIIDHSVDRLPESLAGMAPFLTLLHEGILKPTINRKLLDEMPHPMEVSAYLQELSK